MGQAQDTAAYAELVEKRDRLLKEYEALMALDDENILRNVAATDPEYLNYLLLEGSDVDIRLDYKTWFADLNLIGVGMELYVVADFLRIFYGVVYDDEGSPETEEVLKRELREYREALAQKFSGVDVFSRVEALVHEWDVAQKTLDLAPLNSLQRSQAGQQYEAVRQKLESVQILALNAMREGMSVDTYKECLVILLGESNGVQVRPVGQENWRTWNIQQVSSRFGELSPAREHREIVRQLQVNPILYDRLIGQMYDETTVISWKDGQFGILFEIEFASKESEIDAKDVVDYLPHEEVLCRVAGGLERLSKDFPGIEFAIPHESVIFQGRPAAWAFVPEGVLCDFEHREALVEAMYRLDDPDEPTEDLSVVP
jgi:hypothetical protein